MSVSVASFAGDRSSYAVAQIRFTEQNWNQPVKVHLRTIRDAGEETTGHLRDAIGNGQAGTILVKFVVRTNIGLPAPPPPPTREPESEEQGVIEQTQAEAPQEKYAALINSSTTASLPTRSTATTHLAAGTSAS